MTDDRLARLESAIAALTLAIKQQGSALELLSINDTRLAGAVDRLHRRLLMQEAGTAIYEVQQDRSLN